jgi:pimeloyl-ACP methyl ester carboxylesterase
MKKYAEITKKFIEKNLKDKKIFYITHSFGGRVLLKMFSLFNLPAEKIIYMGVPFYRDEIKKNNKKSLIIKKFHQIFDLPVLKIFKPALQKILYKMIYSSDYLALQNDEVMKETFKNVVSDDISKYIHLVSEKENILI